MHARTCVCVRPPPQSHTDTLPPSACFFQGLASFLPNTTYLQPPGWVHHLINVTWQPLGLTTTWITPSGIAQPTDAYGSRWNNTYSASAARSADGRTMVVRLTSWSAAPISVELRIASREGRRVQGKLGPRLL